MVKWALSFPILSSPNTSHDSHDPQLMVFVNEVYNALPLCASISALRA